MHAWKTYRESIWSIFVVLFAAGLFLLSQLGTGNAGQSVASVVPVTTPGGVSFPIRENKAVYADDRMDVKNLFLTIPDKQNSDRFASLAAFNYVYETVRQDAAQVEVRFDTSMPGPLDTLQREPNAVLTIRGHASAERSVPQKSFKIKLNDAIEPWMGQRTLNLNKHPSDITRFRNKLSFDLIDSVPQMFGLRTQFVHLYIRDLGTPGDQTYVDYGLYTHVEQVNRTYLKSHGIAENAYLYKVNYFEFRYDPTQLVSTDDPTYDEEAFSVLMESGGLNDNSRLLAMIRDVNDMNQDINAVVARHFDRENYLYWLAFNLLAGNLDTNSQNFYLMSPVSDTRWYFIPWDFDGAWNIADQTGSEAENPLMKAIVSNYWGVILHRRFLKNPDNRAELMNVMEKLEDTITPDVIRKRMEQYREATQGMVFKAPDVQFLPEEPVEYTNSFLWMPVVFKDNLQQIRDNLQLPQPVYMDSQPHEEGVLLSWEESFDFQGDALTYAVTVSRMPDQSDPVFENAGTDSTSLDVLGLEPGDYFWHLLVMDAAGHFQQPFDQYVDSNGTVWYGTAAFTVPEGD